MATIRDDEPKPGRLVDTRIGNSLAAEPVLFPLDEFFLSRDGSGALHALYLFPPGYSGHTRGCRIVWDDADTIEFGSDLLGPGLFIDPCGGARFDRDGRLLGGPAERGLDYFGVEPGINGYVVDTRKLFCGPAYAPPDAATPEPEPSVTPAPSATPSLFAPSPSPTATSTPSPTITSTPTPTRTAAVDVATETPEPETCERVTNESKR